MLLFFLWIKCVCFSRISSTMIWFFRVTFWNCGLLKIDKSKKLTLDALCLLVRCVMKEITMTLTVRRLIEWTKSAFNWSLLFGCGRENTRREEWARVSSNGRSIGSETANWACKGRRAFEMKPDLLIFNWSNYDMKTHCDLLKKWNIPSLENEGERNGTFFVAFFGDCRSYQWAFKYRKSLIVSIKITVILRTLIAYYFP